LFLAIAQSHYQWVTKLNVKLHRFLARQLLLDEEQKEKKKAEKQI
jgi:hypothetical protein